MKFWLLIGGVAVLAILGMSWASYTIYTGEAYDYTVEGPVLTEYCWNKVIEEPNKAPYWKDGCNTPDSAKDEVCAQVITKLNQEQLEEYLGWERAGKPSLTGC